jgi:hypothetical protein
MEATYTPKPRKTCTALYRVISQKIGLPTVIVVRISDVTQKNTNLIQSSYTWDVALYWEKNWNYFPIMLSNCIVCLFPHLLTPHYNRVLFSNKFAVSFTAPANFYLLVCIIAVLLCFLPRALYSSVSVLMEFCDVSWHVGWCSAMRQKDTHRITDLFHLGGVVSHFTRAFSISF